MVWKHATAARVAAICVGLVGAAIALAGCASRGTSDTTGLAPTPAARVTAGGGTADAGLIDRVIASGTDVWGEAALRRPEGPTYEYFASLLPPLRYVDTRFRQYPIVLSAPGSPVKGRLVSDGGTINALARQPNWRGETGTPAHVMIGKDRVPFGRDLDRLEGPRYAEGYLPIVQLRYRHEQGVYDEEVFAAVEPELSKHSGVYLKLSMVEGSRGKAEVQFEGTEFNEAQGCVLRDAAGKVLAVFGTQWEYNKFRNTLSADLAAGESATLLILTQPMDEPPVPCVDAEVYRQARAQAADVWTKLVAGGMQVRVPEAYVNNAWRSSVVGNYALLSGDEMRYSAGNQYGKLYIGEGGDTIRAMMLYGHTADARRMMLPQFDYTRKGLEFHQASFKLQMLAHYLRLTGDVETIRAMRPRWEKELNILMGGRETSSGMLPREKYCGDIDTMVYSLNSNANGWRAVRDMAHVLEAVGDAGRAKEVAAMAADWRAVILKSLDQAMRRDVDPPFVPIALSGEETPYERVTESRMSGYWNMMIGYVMASGVFKYDSEPATAVVRYLQQRGGLCMGMVRTRPAASFWVEPDNVNDLYGMRYTLLLLQRDEPDRALVSFYGKLAQAMTRDTFIGGEGSCVRPLDRHGRQFYLPPNSAANSNYLQLLRHLLVQDHDADDDGRPETLRLLFATPRSWLRDGESVTVERAPTTFGEVAAVARSDLSRGRVVAELRLPTDAPPAKALLRLRLPDGYRVASATTGGRALAVDGGETIDITGLRGDVTVEARVDRRR